ncbi:nuclear transport factor 2 family protein [Nakamurella leprariae]|uniref:Nuclear transport factor 2 family protein n=1 Tax=Nakamurella leprariae TaxID=2803911 RepID=A0A938Y9L0_9ACTN|nr:nuclear transport factor 2 family protein [Nakamurella leprariae]MBM9466472.1 nuclear transport factor 2 family protein [Nakamurella leprariae]
MTGVAVVREFLQRMESGDRTGAQALLAPDAEMIFPGGRRFTALDEVAAYGAGRYRSVRKQYLTWDEVPAQHGTAVVVCTGTLVGETLEGTAFDGVRFVDRFSLRDGAITGQQVWNDLAELGVVRPGAGA